jgi:hypothetical protein
MRDGRSNPRLSDMQRSIVADAANREPPIDVLINNEAHCSALDA